MGIDEEPRKSAKKFSAGMKDISGMTVEEMNRLRNTLKPAMKRGNVTFTPNSSGGGVLKTEGGEKILIDNPDEASLYWGIQQEASQKRK